ncbi:hypothetical protein MUN89_05395 [Halobacillus salinarum]|uniref:Uncharacterized protein n=1 Tax=Halobacillus salinarum TaxID=2932257 RepID=A0ABY4ELQ6_9BACI|nr:hypothetical protein [Halobacillus salinarum]UOQ45382.1 hypothetical protein MUN89_05395 [Halobacillus salinarum]
MYKNIFKNEMTNRVINIIGAFLFGAVWDYFRWPESSHLVLLLFTLVVNIWVLSAISYEAYKIKEYKSSTYNEEHL